MNSNSDINNEKNTIIELVNFYHNDYVYRHKNYWNLVYKSIISILGLLIIPYLLDYKVHYQLFIIFPILSIFISFFTIILLESESIRMSLSGKNILDLIKKYLNYEQSIFYRDVIKRNKNGNISRYKTFLLSNITTKILILYIILILLAVFEIYLILNNIFFVIL